MKTITSDTITSTTRHLLPYTSDDGTPYRLRLMYRIEGDIRIVETATHIWLGWLTQDESYDVDDMGMSGNIYNGCDHYQEAVAAASSGTPYMQVVDVYDHSGITYSLTGEGYYCQFDTAVGGAIWVPNADTLEHLALFEGDKNEEAMKIARSDCETLNSIMVGDVWGMHTHSFHKETNDPEGILEAKIEDSCWGFVGHPYAMEELEAELKRVEKEITA